MRMRFGVCAYVAVLSNVFARHNEDTPSFIMPKERPQTIPVLGVAIEIDHRVEHARLDALALLVE